MKETINTAIKTLTERSVSNVDATDSLKLTQAALNLAHILSVQADTLKESKNG